MFTTYLCSPGDVHVDIFASFVLHDEGWVWLLWKKWDLVLVKTTPCTLYISRRRAPKNKSWGVPIDTWSLDKIIQWRNRRRRRNRNFIEQVLLLMFWMQSPRSYGHFEMRLTYEGLSVPKLWAFKEKYFYNLPQTQPQGYCNSDSLFPPGSFVHQNSEKWNIT